MEEVKTEIINVDISPLSTDGKLVIGTISTPINLTSNTEQQHAVESSSNETN